MTTVSDRPAARQNGNKKFTQDIIKQLKEMTNAADEEIQMALQECNGDVNRAAMSIIDNPFQEVKTKKVKPKPSEKPASKPPPRDFPQREKREYGDRPERTDRGDRGDRGRGRDERGGRGGGRGGRGRGFRDGDASQPLAPGSRPITTSNAPAYSDSIGTVPAPATDFYETPALPAVPVAAPTSPPRLPASAPVGSSWASKLKPAPAPVSQPPPEPEPVKTEVVAEADANTTWGMPSQQEALEPAQHDTGADDAFGNGFSHRGEAENAAASWGPPAPGDAAAQWGSPQELSNATLDEAVAKSFETTPAAIPTSVPTTSSPTYNQHQNQQGNFDFSSMASSLGQAGYGTDSKYGNFNIRKDPAQPATSIPFQQGAMPQQADYSAAFSNVFQPQPAEGAGQGDDAKAASHTYAMPSGVPNFAQFTQPPAYQTPYAGLADPSRERKQGMGEYAVHDKKDAGYGMPGQESAAEKPAASLDQRSDDQQRTAMPQPPHQQMPHDMQYSMHMPSPDMQMYNAQQPRTGNQQPTPGQQVMPGQPNVGMQQPQSQGQMGNFLPQQAGMPGYGSYANPTMPYSAMPGFPANNPYGTMNYGMGYPPGAYPQYGYPQGQNFPAQQPPAPYGAGPAAYGGKPGYDNSYGLPQGNGGGRGGGGNAKRNKNRGFGRGAGGAHQQGMALPSEPFNPAAPSGNYNYMDPAWNRGFDAYKQDKNMPGAQQPQFDSYGMQQSFQPVGYGGTYNGQQFTNQPQYSNQWGGNQDSKYQ